MDADLDYCRANKPELYEKAEQGLLQYLPGVDEVYEKPENAQLHFKPLAMTENIALTMQYLQQHKIFPLD